MFIFSVTISLKRQQLNWWQKCKWTLSRNHPQLRKTQRRSISRLNSTFKYTIAELDENSLGKNGCLALLNAKLTQVYSLNLGSHYVSKTKMKSSPRAAGTSRKPYGIIFTNSPWVLCLIGRFSRHWIERMPLPLESSLAGPHRTLPRYVTPVAANNSIAGSGIRYLKKGKWSHLKSLILSS